MREKQDTDQVADVTAVGGEHIKPGSVPCFSPYLRNDVSAINKGNTRQRLKMRRQDWQGKRLKKQPIFQINTLLDAFADNYLNRERITA